MFAEYLEDSRIRAKIVVAYLQKERHPVSGGMVDRTGLLSLGMRCQERVSPFGRSVGYVKYSANRETTLDDVFRKTKILEATGRFCR